MQLAKLIRQQTDMVMSFYQKITPCSAGNTRTQDLVTRDFLLYTYQRHYLAKTKNETKQTNDIFLFSTS